MFIKGSPTIKRIPLDNITPESMAHRCEQSQRFREELNPFEFLMVQVDDPPDVVETRFRLMRDMRIPDQNFYTLLRSKKAILDDPEGRSKARFQDVSKQDKIILVQELEFNVFDLYRFAFEWKGVISGSFWNNGSINTTEFELTYKIFPCKDDMPGLPLRAACLTNEHSLPWRLSIVFTFKMVPLDIPLSPADITGDSQWIRPVRHLRYLWQWDIDSDQNKVPPTGWHKVVIEERLPMAMITQTSDPREKDNFWRTKLPKAVDMDADGNVKLGEFTFAFVVRGKDTAVNPTQPKNKKKHNLFRDEYPFLAAEETERREKSFYLRVPEKPFLLMHDYLLPLSECALFPNSQVFTRFVVEEEFVCRGQEFVFMNVSWERDTEDILELGRQEKWYDIENPQAIPLAVNVPQSCSFVIREKTENGVGRLVAAIVACAREAVDHKNARSGYNRRVPQQVKVPGDQKMLSVVVITLCAVNREIVEDRELGMDLMTRMISSVVDFARWAFLIRFFYVDVKATNKAALEALRMLGFMTLRYSPNFHGRTTTCEFLERVVHRPSWSPSLMEMAQTEYRLCGMAHPPNWYEWVMPKNAYGPEEEEAKPDES